MVEISPGRGATGGQVVPVWPMENNQPPQVDGLPATNGAKPNRIGRRADNIDWSLFGDAAPIMSALSTFARAVRGDSSLFGHVETSIATKASPELAADIGYALDRLRELDAAIEKRHPDYKVVSAPDGLDGVAPPSHEQAKPEERRR
jgi:hypothetical protein